MSQRAALKHSDPTEGWKSANAIKTVKKDRTEALNALYANTPHYQETKRLVLKRHQEQEATVRAKVVSDREKGLIKLREAMNREQEAAAKIFEMESMMRGELHHESVLELKDVLDCFKNLHAVANLDEKRRLVSSALASTLIVVEEMEDVIQQIYQLDRELVSSMRRILETRSLSGEGYSQYHIAQQKETERLEEQQRYQISGEEDDLRTDLCVEEHVAFVGRFYPPQQ